MQKYNEEHLQKHTDRNKNRFETVFEYEVDYDDCSWIDEVVDVDNRYIPEIDDQEVVSVSYSWKF